MFIYQPDCPHLQPSATKKERKCLFPYFRTILYLCTEFIFFHFLKNFTAIILSFLSYNYMSPLLSAIHYSLTILTQKKRRRKETSLAFMTSMATNLFSILCSKPQCLHSLRSHPYINSNQAFYSIIPPKPHLYGPRATCVLSNLMIRPQSSSYFAVTSV